MINCVPSRIRLPNKASEGVWWASGAGHLRLERGARDGARSSGARPGPRCSSRFPSSFSFSPRRRRLRWPRPLSPAPMTRRSPPSSRRSSATRRNSAPMPTIRARRRSTGPAIAAINVSSAAAPLRLWRSSRQTCRPCAAESIARRTRSAHRLARTFVPHIPPSQIRPGPLPSQSDGHSPRAPSGSRSHSFRLEVFLSCFSSVSA